MARLRVLPGAVLIVALLSCDSPTATDPVPAQVTATSGTPQSGTTEDPLPQDLVVRVTDDKGRAMSGVAVAWSVDAGGGTLSAASTFTDSDVAARVQWTLGAAAGSYTARATVAGLAPAAFTATAAWPAPAQLQVVAGNAQNGGPLLPLADSLAVKVVSARGRPVPQATVAWSVAGGGGTLSAATATTDMAGIARVRWTLGAPGPNAATATVGTLPAASFAAFAVPVASIRLSATTVRVGKGDTTKVTATPLDSAGNALQGRTIAWTTSSAATAEVSDSGVVTGRALGTATLTATSEGKSASAGVTVTTEDRTVPRLAGLSFTPTEVDVTSGARTVEFSLRVTDGGSGNDFIAIGFQGPTPGSGASCHGPVSGNAVLASGTPHDGVWKCTTSIPKGATAGTWTIPQLNLIDVAGNQAIYDRAQLVALGLPTTLPVVNTAPPATPPALTGLAFTPDPVNVGSGDATVEIAFTATASAGVRQAYAAMESTRGSIFRNCFADTRTSGTSTNGTWKCTITIPKDAPGGTWRVNTLWVADSASNSTLYSVQQLAERGLPSSFQVTSPTEDVTAPALTGITLDRTTVSLASGATYVQVTLTATDGGVGVIHGSPGLTPPTGSGHACGAEPITGVAQRNATIVCSIPIAAAGVEGKWKLDVYIADAVGNSCSYTWEQLRDAGFVHEITVTR
jgi:hypothetical protein